MKTKYMLNAPRFRLTLNNAQIALLSLCFCYVLVAVVGIVFVVTVAAVFVLFISVFLIISASYKFYSIPRKYLLVQSQQ